MALTFSNAKNHKQDATITVENGALTGTGAGEFKVKSVSSNCQPPTQIPARGKCVFDVTFTPNAVGIQKATLTVTTNSETKPTINIALKGVGKAASVAIAPTSLSFPKTAVGQSSASKTVTLTNKNAAPLMLTYTTPIVVGGADPRSFSISNNMCAGGTLAAGGSCTFDVTFTPAAAAKQSAKISITDNAAKSPQTVKLSGKGG